MLDPGERVLAAFSGGADSTALAIVLKGLGYDVVLGHVDHGMRPDSGRDASHCAAVAQRLHLEFHSAQVVVDPATQAQARSVRYAVLQQMALAAGAGRIATGHTLDDNAETVQLRLERGGYGLGIPPVRGNLIRPLLDLRRGGTENVCRQAGVDFLLDPSNRNQKYRRVVVRERLAAGPDERRRELASLAEDSRAAAEAVAAEVEALWGRVVTPADREVRASRTALRDAGAPVRRQMVRRLAAQLGVELSVRSVEDICGKVLGVTGARLALPGGLSVWSEREALVLGAYPEAAVLPEVAVALDGTTRLPGWGLDLLVEPSTPELTPGGDRTTELIDAAALEGGLSVRQWRPGDRFHPLGAPGSRKLQDFFVDAGVPRAARATVPLVVSGSRIVWVAGHRLDDRFKVTGASRRCLRLRIAAATEQAA
jgi:tRNA(Ile)-lysidine synthase